MKNITNWYIGQHIEKLQFVHYQIDFNTIILVETDLKHEPV